jgi:hypothetical protein
MLRAICFPGHVRADTSSLSPHASCALVRRGISFATLCAIAMVTLVPVEHAVAQTADVSLNVFFNNPLDLSSGGTWEVVGKTSATGGFAGLDVRLAGINLPNADPIGPRGVVNGGDPAGFSIYVPVNLSDHIELVIGQAPIGAGNLQSGEEEAVFYGVGSLANGAPEYMGKPVGSNSIGPTFTSLTDVKAVAWGTGDVFGQTAWDKAVRFATGTFDAGSVPSFVSQGMMRTNASVYPTAGTSTAFPNSVVVDPVTTTLVRTNVEFAGSADYNDNGVVDAADYVLWRMTRGQEGSHLAADGNLNGVVDNGDYQYWRSSFGKVLPGAGASAEVPLALASVPEPATVTLLLGAAGLLVLRRPMRDLRKGPVPVKKALFGIETA